MKKKLVGDEELEDENEFDSGAGDFDVGGMDWDAGLLQTSKNK